MLCVVLNAFKVVESSLSSLDFSLKMHMAWRNLQLKSCASTTTKTLALSVVLEGSITYMVHLEHGKVYS